MKDSLGNDPIQGVKKPGPPVEDPAAQNKGGQRGDEKPQREIETQPIAPVQRSLASALHR